MKSSSRTRILRRLAAITAVAVSVLVTTGSPASAAPPSNDGIAGATAITDVPMRDVADLSLATWDFATDYSFCNGFDHSVWYSFTPAADTRVAIDPSASNQTIAIDVFTGTPDALQFVGCGQGGPAGYSRGGFLLDAVAGTTYWIMASPICCAAVPILDLSVYPAVAPQATLSVDSGTVDRGGNVTITGTLDCVGVVPGSVEIRGGVHQPVGRLSSVASMLQARVPCGSRVIWSALAQPNQGRFVGGPATVGASATVCNIVGCATPSTTVVINFRG